MNEFYDLKGDPFSDRTDSEAARMADCCVNKCFINIPCSGEFVTVNNLQEEEKLTVYREIHLLPSYITETFQICSAHKQQVEANVKRRFRRKECDVTSILGPLAVHTTKKVGDRHVTGSMFKKLAEKNRLFHPCWHW